MTRKADITPNSKMEAREKAKLWIYGPISDLLVGCGAWTLPLLAINYIGTQHSFVATALCFYILAIFCNNPHFMATIYRAYGTRADFQKYRIFTVYITVFMILTAVVVHWKPQLLPLLFTTYLIWSPWHYTGQNFGLALMMARRAGAQPSRRERNLIYASFLASYLLWVVALNSGPSHDPRILSLGIPLVLSKPIQIALAFVFFGAGLYGFSRLIRQTGFKSVLGALVLFSTQFLWFVLPNIVPYFVEVNLPATYYSAGILAFMHCAQYLWITSYYARRELEAGSSRRNTEFKAWRYYLTLVLGGIMLFIPGPWVVSKLFRHDLLESLLIFMALVNIHHFILDGAIWKLRDGKIAQLLIGRAHAQGDRGRVELEPLLGWLIGKTLPARAFRILCAAAIVGVGYVDQLQYYLTLQTTTFEKLETAERLNRNDSRVYFRRAKLLRMDGKEEAAMEQLNEAIRVNPYNFPPQEMKGELYVRRGEIEEAFQHYERMGALFKPMAGILLNAGVFAAQLGDPEKAVEKYNKALQLDPRNIELHLYLAEAYSALGDFEDAAENFETYIIQLEAKGLNTGSLNKFLLVELKLAEAYEADGNFPEALWWYRAVAAQAQSDTLEEIRLEVERRIEEITE